MRKGLLKCKNCGKDTNTEIYQKRIVDGQIMTLIFCDRCPQAKSVAVPAILKGGRKGRAPVLKSVQSFDDPVIPAGVKIVDTDRTRFRDSVDVPGRKVVYCGGYNASQRKQVLEKKYGIDESYNIISDNGFKLVADPR